MSAAVESKRSGKPSRRRKWINVLITVLGALIVFFTFVVKESKVDKLKELAGLIDRSQDAYLIRSDVIAANNRIQDLREELEALRIRFDNPGYAKHGFVIRNQDDIDMMDDEVNSKERLVLESARVSLESIDRLVEKLPQDAQQNASAAKLRAYLDDADQETKNYQQFSLLRDTGKKKEAAVLKKTIDSEVNEIKKKKAQFQLPIENEIENFRSNVVKRADAVRKSDEESLRNWQFWGYFLYGLGWTIGLAGHWFGVEGARESE